MNLIRKLFTPFSLLISIFLFIYTFYRAEIFWSGSKSDYYLIYYIFSATLFIFSFIFFYLPRNLKDYAIVIIVTIIFSLYCFEGLLNIKKEPLNLKKQKEQEVKKKLYKIKTGKDFDNRPILEIYNSLLNNYKNVSIVNPPHIYYGKKKGLFPISGVSNAITVFCNENGYRNIYKSDRFGFNNPDDEWNKKEIEFFLVGDSFTHGACVNRPDDIGSLLRKFSNKPVLNLGFGGNGPLIEYITLREYLGNNVKNVIWLYFEGNDLDDLKNELSNNILKQYLIDINFSQNLKKRQFEIDEILKKTLDININKKKNYFHKLFNFLKLFKTRQLLELNSFQTSIKKQQDKIDILEFQKILISTKKLTDKSNSKLYFVYLPEYYRYTKEYDNKKYLEVKNLLNKLNINFIDITKVFDESKNPLKYFPFELPGHYNENGYLKVSEAIFNFINK